MRKKKRKIRQTKYNSKFNEFTIVAKQLNETFGTISYTKSSLFSTQEKR